MNRILTTIIALWSVCTMAGLPPTTLSGEQATTKPTTFTFETPNYQGTQISGIKSRVETGNTNLLVNPSFEHSTVTTGWTITNATASADTTNQVEGKKALSLALTGTLSVVQDSTINAANLVGLQGNASIKIKTSDVDGLKVCARNAGVTSTSLCINIPKDGVWKEINIPYILTATSNGIAITSTGTTGTVKLDDAFIGTSAPFQGVNGAKLVGTWYVASTASCSLTSTSSTFNGVTSMSSCPVPTVTGDVSISTTNSGKTNSFIVNNVKAGTYKMVGRWSVDATTSGGTVCDYGIKESTDTSPKVIGFHDSNLGIQTVNMQEQFTYSTSSTSKEFNLSLMRATGTGTCTAGAYTNSGVMAVEVYYFPPESKIYSQASQDYDWTAYTPTFTGFGTVSSSSCYHKRRGSDLYVKCRATAGTPTAVTAQVSLPNALTIASSISTRRDVGLYFRGTTTVAHGGAILGLAGDSYVTFSDSGVFGNISANALSSTNGDVVLATGQEFSFTAGPIPIQGWQDYGVIVGSFVEVPTVPSQNNVEIFSVSYGTTNATTVCSASPCSYLDQIGTAVTSITRSSTGVHTLNTSKTYVKLKCTYNGYNGINVPISLGESQLNCSNTNACSFATRRTDTGALADAFGTLYCQGIKQ